MSNWEKYSSVGIAFGQTFLMGQFGAMSAITWINKEYERKLDEEKKRNDEMQKQVDEMKIQLNTLRRKSWWI